MFSFPISQGNITLYEGRGNTFIVFLRKGRNGDCGNAENSREDLGILEETIPECQAGDFESLLKMIIGMLYSGKLNVRFDDGKLERTDE